jgi:hypothetical protein
MTSINPNKLNCLIKNLHEIIRYFTAKTAGGRNEVDGQRETESYEVSEGI